MLKSKNFTFNGIENTEMGVLLVSFDNNTLNSIDVPFERSVSSSEYSSIKPMFATVDNEPSDIVLSLMYIDQNYRALQWNDDKIFEIQNWLITDEFAPFQEEYSEYKIYLMCTKIEKKMILPTMQGVLECTFKPYSHYKYKEYSTSLSVSSGSKTVNIENPSKFIYRPLIKLTNTGDTNTTNSINGFQIKGLSYGETVIIDSQMATVVSTSGVNKFSLCNRSWVELQPGYTNLSISGKCSVEILCEFPLLV